MSDLPATYADDLMVGLEDFDPDKDAVIPTIKLDHKECSFKDGLSGEQYGSTIKVVLLGLVKQRIMWDADIKDDPKPMCKSPNHSIGLPGADFPWAAYTDKTGVVKPAELSGVQLDCATCPYQEWGSHPKNDTPWCTELYTFPLVMVDDDGVPGMAGIFTLQRSGIKPTKGYLTAFATKKQPLFTVVTEIKLTGQRRGNVDYAVPSFTKLGQTDQSEWAGFAARFRGIRDVLQSIRAVEETGEDDLASDDGVPAPRKGIVESTEATDTPTEADVPEVVGADDDDLPF